MKRERKQELKQDDFVDTLVWAWETVKARQREITIGLVAGLVIIALGLFVIIRMRQANEMAWSTLATLDDSAQMDRMGGKSPEAPQALAEKYRKLAADYPRSGVAPLSLYKAARLFHQAGKLDEALKTFDELLSSYSRSEIAGAADSGKAAVLEDMGKYAEAKALYEKAADSGPKYLTGECYLNAGRCAELTKDTAGARKLYEKTIAVAAGTEWAELAEERLKGMGKPKETAPASPEKKS